LDRADRGVRRSLVTRRATTAGVISTGPGKEKVKGTESPAGLLLQLQNG
jgi:hypothetical protein